MSGNQVRLTNAEFAVLEALWKGGPQTIRALTARLYPKGSDSDYATVQKLLERLESKQSVIRDRSGMAHVFRAAKDRGDLLDEQLKEVADKLCEGSMTPMLMHLIEGSELTGRERERIRELLDQPQRDRKEDR